MYPDRVFVGPESNMKQQQRQRYRCGMAVCAAVIIIISTVTVSRATAETGGYTNSNEGFTSHFVSGGGGGGGVDHEDYTNPNIYDGKRTFT